MDIAGLVASFATGTYTVTRTARGNTSYGVVSAGTQTTFTIRASVSPLGDEDLVRVPEGRRTMEARLIFSTTQLYLGGQGDAYEADIISIQSESWQVTDEDNWLDPVSGATGYRYIAWVLR